ncbi:MAG: DUF3859 domain-containing protein [Leptolyngbyaceae cyanobacterium bins.59]|nr:DUF3859 domain-containing protein [Leptolyngbyaceae cyanobacterium bins.59]
MDDRLSEVQLQRIVSEVEQLSNRRQQELDQEQVREILQELNLSPALLEEAMIQLKRRDALEIQQRRQRRMIVGIVLALLLIGSGGVFLFQSNQQQLNRISAQQNRITLVQDDGGMLKTIDRQKNAELFYRVTLQDAPVGKQLSLSCNWIALNDQLMHQNRYQTKEITTSVWTTYCRYRVGPSAPPGTWRVQMRVGDRVISENSFDVK